MGAAWVLLGVNAAGEDVPATARGFLGSLIWYLYFRNSERVRNAYLGDPTHAIPAAQPGSTLSTR